MTNPDIADRITRAYFDSICFEARHIDNVLPDTSIRLFGKTLPTPIMTAPLSHLERIREDGMAELARGAKAAGVVDWIGMGDLDTMDRVLATGAQVVKMIKPYKDREEVYKRIRFAEEHGAFAVGMDIDHAFNPAGEYGVMLGEPLYPVTTEEIRELAASTKLPFIIKGILSPRDAEKCAKAGVDAIVVSHHHGVIDYAAPPLKVLPRIIAAIGHSLPLIVDCGIESGSDAFKAMALGADAVCVGRALMDPLKNEGAAGAEKKLRELMGEFKAMMARTGYAKVEDIDDSCIVW